MRRARLFLFAMLLALPFAATAHAQVMWGVGVGPVLVDAPGYYGAPVCEWGYYAYYPYACAPYGYYGPDWFYGGVFIGAGPWYHRGWYGGRGWGGRGWGGRGWGGRGGYAIGARGAYGARGGYAARGAYGGGTRGGVGGAGRGAAAPRSAPAARGGFSGGGHFGGGGHMGGGGHGGGHR